MLNDGTVFTAFDTETTGLTVSNSFVIEIGAVKFDKTGIIDKFSTLINPQKPIPESASAINNITDDMVKDAPKIDEVLDSFLEFTKDTVLIAHNANFDVNFINEECVRNNKTELKNSFLDTLNLVRWAYPLLGKYNLQLMARLMNIEVTDAHRAYDDARVCMELFNRVIEDTKSIQKK
ncbi:MAG: 3'-5' exonuclease [Treponema sp.]|nr:3'-5' exonuclease [Treponema sp.]